MDWLRISQKLITAATCRFARLVPVGYRVAAPVRRRARYLAGAATAWLAAFAVTGAAQPAALASSSPVPTWTQQSPVTSPPARAGAEMAYDAATRTVVLYGGGNVHGSLVKGTWLWDGTTWAKRAPATHPANLGSMVYDAATGTRRPFGDTWTWS